MKKQLSLQYLIKIAFIVMIASLLASCESGCYLYPFDNFIYISF